MQAYNNKKVIVRTIQREIVGAFIFSADEKILLGNAGVFSDSWSVPGGGIEEGETNTEAVNREIMEETGIDISKQEVIAIDLVNSASSEKVLRDTKERVFVEMNFHDFTVHMKQVANKIKVVSADDFTNATWHDIDSLKAINLAPGTKKRLAQLGYDV